MIPRSQVMQQGNPYLLLQMQFPVLPVKQLITGKLVANWGKSSVAYAVTSGCPWFQCKEGESWIARGQLPQAKLVGLEGYSVKLNPVYLPSVRGVEGNFYPISPKWIKVNKRTRGDFGIHMDKNVPGSAGCIVITMENHWKKLEDWFKTLSNSKYDYVPLYTDYTYI